MATERADLDQFVASLNRLTQPSLDVIDALQEITDFAVSATAAASAGVVLVGPGAVLGLASSSTELFAEAEDAQLGTNQGPTVDAIRTGTHIHVSDLRTQAAEWPVFVHAALSRGFGGVHVTPLWLARRVIGSLCLFTVGTRGLGDRDVVIAQVLAAVSTMTLVERAASQGDSVDRVVRRTLDDRIAIEQAKGALAYRRALTIDDAFTLLRDHARDRLLRLRDVADSIVRGGSEL